MVSSSITRRSTLQYILVTFICGIRSAPMDRMIDGDGHWDAGSDASLHGVTPDNTCTDPPYLPYQASIDSHTPVYGYPAYYNPSYNAQWTLTPSNEYPEQYERVPFYLGQVEPHSLYHQQSQALPIHSLYQYPPAEPSSSFPPLPLAPAYSDMWSNKFPILESNPDTTTLYPQAEVDDESTEATRDENEGMTKSIPRKPKEEKVKRPRGRPKGQYGPRLRSAYSKPSIGDSDRIIELKGYLPGRYTDIINKYRSSFPRMSRQTARTDVADGADKDLGYALLHGTDAQQAEAVEKIATKAAQRRENANRAEPSLEQT